MRAPVILIVVALAAGCVIPRGESSSPYYEDLLAGDPFTDLVVEIDHAPGRVPSVVAREHLLAQLRAVTSKERVSVVLEETLRDDATKRWSADDLVKLEAQTRSAEHKAPTAVLHVLYPAGRFENDSVAGVTVGGVVLGPVTVFLDTLNEVGSPVGPLPMPQEARDEIERGTLLHEAGHAMGLVDNGLPMVEDHEDPAHEGHSSNPESVMYWQVESTSGIREALLHDGSVPIYFDEDDRQDVRSAGGR